MLFSRSVELRPADLNPLVQLRAAQNAVLASAPACRRLRFAPGLTSARRSHKRAGRKACCWLCPTPGLKPNTSKPKPFSPCPPILRHSVVLLPDQHPQQTIRAVARF